MNLLALFAVETGGIFSLFPKLAILLITVLGSRLCTPYKSFDLKLEFASVSVF